MPTKCVFIRVFCSALLLPVFAVANIAQGNDSLIAFGRACLATETQLAQTQTRLTDRTTNNKFNRSSKTSPNSDVNRLEQEKDQLKVDLEKCAATQPNSAFCHQARQRDNELTYLIDKAKTASIREPDTQDASTDDDDLRHQFDEDYARFIAQCRDSNAHYALIQNPTAYQAICSEEKTKQSITCSFF